MTKPGHRWGSVARAVNTLVSRPSGSGRAGVGRATASIPEAGYEPSSRPTPLLDAMTDEEVRRLNEVLPWRCFTVDGRGRRVGQAAWTGKRTEPQAVPDPRIERLHELCPLDSLHVLEVGCFEGVHTVALCDRAARVTAVDGRVDNVAKTLVRTGLYGCHPDVFVCDLEREPEASPRLACDVVHHVGVLYHLADPVAHLLRLLPSVTTAIMLDTHVARPGETNDTYTSGGSTWAVWRYAEQGIADPFSGLQDFSRWLQLDDLKSILSDGGFNRVEWEEQRDERNGLRVNLIVRRG